MKLGSWRWTAGSFEVSLRPPIAAAQKGAILSFAFSIPEVVMQKVGPVTLTASIGSTKLAPAKYTAPGAYTYNAEVPAALLGTPTVNIGFVLDKFLAPGAVDQRELGLVATSVGLESK